MNKNYIKTKKKKKLKPNNNINKYKKLFNLHLKLRTRSQYRLYRMNQSTTIVLLSSKSFRAHYIILTR